MDEKDYYIDRALVEFKRACEESDHNLKNKNKYSEKIPLEIFENLQA